MEDFNISLIILHRQYVNSWTKLLNVLPKFCPSNGGRIHVVNHTNNVLCEFLGKILQRHIYLESMLPGLVTGLPFAVTLFTLHRITRLSFALADTSILVVAVAEPRQRNLRQRDGDILVSLASDQLTRGNELLQVLFDLATDDLPEPGVVLINATNRHCHSPFVSPRAKIDAT